MMTPMSKNVVNANEALPLYLKHYPGKNDAEFEAFYGAETATAHAVVRRILNEAMTVQPDWNRMSLNEAGDLVEATMSKRHPDLTPKSLECIGNYYTYLMR